MAKKFMNLYFREEMSRASDLNDYYSIPLDSKILIIQNSLKKEIKSKFIEDYTSHNTKQLNLEVKSKLLELPYIRNYLSKN